MRLALSLAKRGKGKTSPNPLVGAVIVRKGKLVGQGYHKKAGLPHAEINALKEAGPKAKGAELYLNLEPCNHYGRTPPCTEVIISSGIKRVVVGMEDPNPLVKGKGIQRLRNAGILVEVGILEAESRKLNEVFIKYITTGLPFLILKMASSLDGKIATKIGDSYWITNERARRFVHRLRAEVDAVLVGIGTILRDDPLLTCRLGSRKEKNPIRIVVDSRLRIPPKTRVIGSETIIATTELAPKERIKELEDLGVKILIVESLESKVDLQRLVSELGKLEISNVLIEGGSQIGTSFLAQRLVDKILFFYAPKIIGGRDSIPIVGGKGVDRVADAIPIRDIKVRRFGDNLLIEGYLYEK